jgi:hypothetical protein
VGREESVVKITLDLNNLNSMKIKKHLIATLCTITGLINLPGIAHAASLTTTFASGNGQDGNMFDVVVNEKSLTVTSLDLNIDRGTIAELYVKPGTYQGFATDSSAWTLIGTVSGIATNGGGIPTNVDFADFVLPSNQTTALYVTMRGGLLNYTNGTSVGNIAAQNSDLQILEGAGKQYPFSLTFEPRIWNGTINYSVNATAIPEPLTVLGSVTALGFGVLFKRQRSRR